MAKQTLPAECRIVPWLHMQAFYDDLQRALILEARMRPRPLLDALVRRLLYPRRQGIGVVATSRAIRQPEIQLHTPLGHLAHGLYWPAPDARPTLLFFHGLGGHVFDWADFYAEFAECRIGMLMVEFPGHGKAPGSPSEEHLYDAGRGGVEWLVTTQGVSLKQIIAFGNSFGGGVASQIAFDYPLGGLVLESSFTSLFDVVAERLPWVPHTWLALLLRNEQFNTVAKLPFIRARPQNLWVKTTRRQEEIGLKTVLAMMGDQSPKPPGILRIDAGGKLALGEAVVGQAGAAKPSPNLPPAPGTALGLLPSRALSSAQAEGDCSRRGHLGHGVQAGGDL